MLTRIPQLSLGLIHGQWNEYSGGSRRLSGMRAPGDYGCQQGLEAINCASLPKRQSYEVGHGNGKVIPPDQEFSSKISLIFRLIFQSFLKLHLLVSTFFPAMSLDSRTPEVRDRVLLWTRSRLRILPILLARLLLLPLLWGILHLYGPSLRTLDWSRSMTRNRS